MRTLRAVLILSLLVFAAGAAWGSTSESRPVAIQSQQAAMRSTGLLSQAWSFLTNLWGAAGCWLDPLGASEGCRLDPLGAQSTSDTPLLDHGCRLDPLGGDEGCGISSLDAPAADHGCGLDPLGGCLPVH